MPYYGMKKGDGSIIKKTDSQFFIGCLLIACARRAHVPTGKRVLLISECLAEILDDIVNIFYTD